MTVLATCTFDDLTPGSLVKAATLPAGWTTVDSTNAATATATNPIHGTGSVAIGATTSVVRLEHRQARTNGPRVLSWYIRADNHPAITYLAACRDAGTVRADVRWDAAGTITLRNGFAAAGTSTETLTTGVVYRVEWLLAASGQELRAYEGEATSPVLAVTAPLSNSSLDELTCGLTASPGEHILTLDTVRVADDWVGPFSPGPPVPDIASRYRYDGTAWVPLGTPVLL